MPKLYNKETGALIGTITDTQLKLLIDQLEEETRDDQDYYINETTIDMLAEAGADEGFVNMLKEAMSGREDMEVRWSRS